MPYVLFYFLFLCEMKTCTFNSEETLSGYPDSYRLCLADISVYHGLITYYYDHKASCVLWDVCVFVLVTDWAHVCVTGVSDSLSVRERERLKRLSAGL